MWVGDHGPSGATLGSPLITPNCGNLIQNGHFFEIFVSAVIAESRLVETTAE